MLIKDDIASCIDPEQLDEMIASLWNLFRFVKLMRGRKHDFSLHPYNLSVQFAGVDMSTVENMAG